MDFVHLNLQHKVEMDIVKELCSTSLKALAEVYSLESLT
jgi:hypothetical protein